MGWDGVERRRKKRYGIRNSTVRYKKATLLSFLSPASAKYLLLNFSETGCHFITEELLEVDAPLTLYLDSPHTGGTATLKGRVVWARKSDKLDAYRVGVEFAGISARAKGLLKNMLDSAVLENVDITTKQYMKDIEKL